MKDKGEIMKPNIRFDGFEDEWVEKKLGDVAEVKYGRDYKNMSQIGNIPVYGTGGMLAMIDKCQSTSSDAIGLGRKGTINKPFVLKAPFWTVDTLFQIYPKTSLDLFFQLYLFNNINWLKYNESTGVPSLSKSNIENVVRKLPTLPEQQKIGQLFKHLDARISNEQNKIEQLKAQKKGLLQRVL